MGESEAPAGSSVPPLDLSDVRNVLARIEAVVRDPRVVLVGGQAVSVWFEQLASRLGSMLDASQVVSGDLDFLGGRTMPGEWPNCLAGAFTCRARRIALH